MRTINEDIESGNLKPVYLLFGEEEYLKKQYKEKLIRVMLPDGDTMNFSRFEGKGILIPKLIDLAETLPFFAERRVILVEESGFFKNASADLADYMILKKM